MEFLFAALALLCAFGAGYYFGSIVPDWRDDIKFEDIVEERGHGHGHGDNWWAVDNEGCFSWLVATTKASLPTSCSARSFGLLLLALMVLFNYNAWDPPKPPDYQSHLMTWLLFRPYWLLLVSLVGGYVYSRIADRGPVGPLE